MKKNLLINGLLIAYVALMTAALFLEGRESRVMLCIGGGCFLAYYLITSNKFK
ncbi:MAG: hypothetical protein IKW58_02135 [Alphaproteobacteria bacterium]|nr:hypothetical protein [Alphaproteobacteria bacterium]